MNETTIRYTTPLQDVKFEECLFYTVQDIPGLTEPTNGEWDLRSNTPAYLGNVEFNGKSVLELRNLFRNFAELILSRTTNKNNGNQLPFMEFLPNSEKIITSLGGYCRLN